MTDIVVVLRKLALLREHVQRVRRRRPHTAAALAADVDILDALSMSLLVAVQETVDVAFHLCADESWGVPASYAESFDVLARHGILSDELARRLSGTTALRNRLAHGYASADVERLWTELPHGLEALEEFASAVAGWLGRDER